MYMALQLFLIWTLCVVNNWSLFHNQKHARSQSHPQILPKGPLRMGQSWSFLGGLSGEI